MHSDSPPSTRDKPAAGASILIVDDELAICRSCRDVLTGENYGVDFALSAKEAIALIEKKSYDLILTDLKMPEIDGIGLLEHIKKNDPDIPVIVITAYATVETAVEAMRKGACDYISKPFSSAELRMAVEQALEKSGLVRQIRYFRKMARDRHELEHVVGVSPAIKHVYELVDRVAPGDTTVLLHGESGTGKEVIAKAIHYSSGRSEKQFIAVDCASLAEGLLESELFGHDRGSFTGAISSKQGLLEIAGGGTLFLDEISNFTLDLQGKLLRVLEQREFRRVGGTKTRKVDVRVIAATNRKLQEMVQEETFREDLFYRLNVFPIYLPPLRERREDIPVLAQNFLDEFSGRMRRSIKGYTKEAMQHLVEYDWPGNVRELRNAVERVVIMADDRYITREDLAGPDSAQKQAVGMEAIPRTVEELKQAKKALKQKLADRVEREFLADALKRNHWNVTRAARETGMDRRNFQNLLRKHKLSPHDPSK